MIKTIHSITFTVLFLFFDAPLHAGNQYVVIDDTAVVTSKGKIVRTLVYGDVVSIGAIQQSDDQFIGSVAEGEINLASTSFINQRAYDLVGDEWNGYRIQFAAPRIKYQNKITQGPETKLFSDKLILFATSYLLNASREGMQSVTVNGKKIYYTREIDDEMVGFKQMTCMMQVEETRWCAISVIYHPINRISARRIAFSLQVFSEK